MEGSRGNRQYFGQSLSAGRDRIPYRQNEGESAVKCRCQGESEIVNATVEGPMGSALRLSILRSIKFFGCAWAYRTTFRPLKVPTAAPSATSLAQCLL